MASKKLEYSDIAKGKVLDPLIKEVEELNKLLGVTSDALKDIIKEGAKLSKGKPLDSYENIKDVEEGIKKTKKAVEDLDKVEKERIRLQEKISQLNDERIKDNFKLREEAKKLTRQLREEAKATVEQQNAYKKLSKATNEAQAEFKKLAAELGVNSKEAQEAKKKFDELNDQLTEIDKAAKDGRRNVGRYRESLEGINIGGINAAAAVDGLTDAFKAFAANPVIFIVTALAAALGTLFAAFKKSNQGSILLRKGAALLEASFSLLVDIVNDAVTAIIAFTDDPLEGLKKLGKSLVETIINRFQAVVNILKLAGDAIKALIDRDFERLGEIAKQTGDEFLTMATGIGNVTEKLGNLTDKVNDTANAFLALEEAQRAVQIQNRNLEIQVAKAQKSIELLTAAADDDGRSLEEQRKAIKAAGEERERVSKLEVQIARNNLKLLNQELAIRQQNGENVDELLDRRKDALIALSEVETNVATTRFENAARERMILLDMFDQELDDLIDFADNLKTIREQIAGDENVNILERRKALEDAEKDLNRSFTNQVKLFENTVNELKASRGEATDFALPIDELLGIEDATELNKRIQQLDLVERQRIRLLELLRERRTVANDLRVANNELTKSERDQFEVEQDIILQQEVLLALREKGAKQEELFANLEKKRRDNEKEFLKERIAELDENSFARVQLEKQLNDILLEEQKKFLDEQKKLDEKAKKEQSERDKAAAEKRKELTEAAFSTLKGLRDKRNEEIIEGIDKEIDANQKRQDRLAELAAQGNQTAEENLATAQRRQAELEQQRAAALRRQKREELAFTAIQTYTAKVQAGDKQPLASTITDIALLQSFIGSLTGFFDGTEDTGDKGIISDEKGVITGYTHANERVLTKKQNSMIPTNMSNMELAMLAQNSRNSSKEEIFNQKIEAKLDGIKSAIENKPTYLGRDYDPTAQSIIDTIAKKGKMERNHRKTGGIWGN